MALLMLYPETSSARQKAHAVGTSPAAGDGAKRLGQPGQACSVAAHAAGVSPWLRRAKVGRMQARSVQPAPSPTLQLFAMPLKRGN